MFRTAYVTAAICAAGILVYATEAQAQCAARDALNKTMPTASSVSAPAAAHEMAAAPNVWKRIALGAFANSFALRNALDAANCGVGDLAEEAIARPAFTLASAKTDVDLVVVSAAELGFAAEFVSLKDIYDRAGKLGLSLAPAEVGPALRLQYRDQPIGEFLHVGMKPIVTWRGDPVIFVIVNGGAGLVLIGKNANADALMPVTSAFLFVRPRGPQKVATEEDPAGR